jgi:hypothetical protein
LFSLGLVHLTGGNLTLFGDVFILDILVAVETIEDSWSVSQIGIWTLSSLAVTGSKSECPIVE